MLTLCLLLPGLKLTSHGKRYSMDFVKATILRVRETSSDKSINFPSYLRFICLPFRRPAVGFVCYAHLPHGHWPCMKFLFVGADVCRRLPPDSRVRTPLARAAFPLLGATPRIFHPLAGAHAERHAKKYLLEPSDETSIHIYLDISTVSTRWVSCKNL